MPQKRKTSSLPAIQKKSKKKLTLWHLAGIFMLFFIYGFFIIYANNANPFKIHTLIYFPIFIFVQFMASKKFLYSKPIANRFFASWKAIDIWTHIFGTFTFYLLFLVLFSLTNEISFIITIVLTSLFELLEFVVEKAGKLAELRTKTVKGTYTKYISEPIGNIAQDIITNVIGAIIAYFYVFFFIFFL